MNASIGWCRRREPRGAGQRAVTQYVVAELDQSVRGNARRTIASKSPSGPAVKHVDADAQPAHLGQRDGVAQGVGEMDVGIEAGGVLDRQRHTARSACSRTARPWRRSARRACCRVRPSRPPVSR